MTVTQGEHPPGDPLPDQAGGTALAWASFILAAAALYNLSWGLVAALAPRWCLELLGLDAGNAPLVQCIGMLVGVYGLGYWIAGRDPARFWPLVFVGLVGKLLGPVGGLWTVGNGTLPATILWVNLTNDVLWWLPFGWILVAVHRRKLTSAWSGTTCQGSLYERLLGPSFHDLKLQLQRFHSATQPIEVTGRFSVERSDGRLANWIANLEGFPKATDAVVVQLRVEPATQTERWHRSFGERTLTSTQWLADGYLAERLGFVTLYMRAAVDDGSLVIRSVRSTAFGFPLPPFLAPHVAASGHDTPEGMRIRVVLGLVPLGTLVDYGGVVSIANSR